MTYQAPELTVPTLQLVDPGGLHPELSPQQYASLRSDQLLLEVQQQQAALQQQSEAELGLYLQENPLAIMAAAAAAGLETGVRKGRREGEGGRVLLSRLNYLLRSRS